MRTKLVDSKSTSQGLKSPARVSKGKHNSMSYNLKPPALEKSGPEPSNDSYFNLPPAVNNISLNDKMSSSLQPKELEEEIPEEGSFNIASLHLKKPKKYDFNSNRLFHGCRHVSMNQYSSKSQENYYEQPDFVSKLGESKDSCNKIIEVQSPTPFHTVATQMNISVAMDVGNFDDILIFEYVLEGMFSSPVSPPPSPPSKQPTFSHHSAIYMSPDNRTEWTDTGMEDLSPVDPDRGTDSFVDPAFPPDSWFSREIAILDYHHKYMGELAQLISNQGVKSCKLSALDFVIEKQLNDNAKKNLKTAKSYQKFYPKNIFDLQKLNPRKIQTGACKGYSGFLSILSFLATTRKELLKNIFSPNFNQDPNRITGKYLVRLFVDGEWTEVEVDEKIPLVSKTTINKLDGLQIRNSFKENDNEELKIDELEGLTCKLLEDHHWVPLLQKAYAKVFGGYHTFMDPVEPVNLLRELTGLSASRTHLSTSSMQNDHVQISTALGQGLPLLFESRDREPWTNPEGSISTNTCYILDKIESNTSTIFYKFSKINVHSCLEGESLDKPAKTIMIPQDMLPVYFSSFCLFHSPSPAPPGPETYSLDSLETGPFSNALILRRTLSFSLPGLYLLSLCQGDPRIHSPERRAGLLSVCGYLPSALSLSLLSPQGETYLGGSLSADREAFLRLHVHTPSQGVISVGFGYAGLDIWQREQGRRNVIGASHAWAGGSRTRPGGF